MNENQNVHNKLFKETIAVCEVISQGTCQEMTCCVQIHFSFWIIFIIFGCFGIELMFRMRLIIFLLINILFGICSDQIEIYVDSVNGDDGNTGEASNPYQSLQKAFLRVNNTDDRYTIYLADGSLSYYFYFSLPIVAKELNIYGRNDYLKSKIEIATSNSMLLDNSTKCFKQSILNIFWFFRF